MFQVAEIRSEVAEVESEPQSWRPSSCQEVRRLSLSRRLPVNLVTSGVVSGLDEVTAELHRFTS